MQHSSFFHPLIQLAHTSLPPSLSSLCSCLPKDHDNPNSKTCLLQCTVGGGAFVGPTAWRPQSRNQQKIYRWEQLLDWVTDWLIRWRERGKRVEDPFFLISLLFSLLLFSFVLSLPLSSLLTVLCYSDLFCPDLFCRESRRERVQRWRGSIGCMEVSATSDHDRVERKSMREGGKYGEKEKEIISRTWGTQTNAFLANGCSSRWRHGKRSKDSNGSEGNCMRGGENKEEMRGKKWEGRNEREEMRGKKWEGRNEREEMRGKKWEGGKGREGKGREGKGGEGRKASTGLSTKTGRQKCQTRFD